MLYDGPWRDAIVAYDASNVALFERHVATARAAIQRADRHYGTLPSLEDERQRACDHDRHGAVGVMVGDEIEAIAIYCLLPSVRSGRSRPGVMHLAISVAGPYRRKGMATALLARCMTIARCAGAQHLLFDGIACDLATRAFARALGADLIFKTNDCQAWIGLAPADQRTPAIDAAH